MMPVSWLRAAVVAVACLVAGACSRNCATCSTLLPPQKYECGNVDADTWKKLEKAIAGANTAPSILMLSGGGSFGAWGAGALNGWSERESGQRPKFQLVTGSSTGAILGTWAFLGSEADASAKCAYTDTADDDVYDKALLSWIWLQPWRWRSVPPWVSLKNLGPLRDLFRRYTSKEQVEKVGRIYQDEGRIFLTGTVDIDLGTFCYWDMGKIAARMIGASDAEKQKTYDLYMEVVMASSSNPGIFNPTFLPSEIDGDMHVDGGVRHQIFMLPKVEEAVQAGLALWRKNHPAAARSSTTAKVAEGGSPDKELGRLSDPECNTEPDGVSPRMYAVVNLPTVVPRRCTGNNVYDIAQRSLTVLTIQSLIGDLHQAKHQWKSWLGSPSAGDFCVSRIPEATTTWPFADDFPECAMRKLYDDAVDKATSPEPWESRLPSGGASPLPCSDEPYSKPKKKCIPKAAPGCGKDVFPDPGH